MIQFNKQLYLVRHGETEFNIEGIMQGHVDSVLTSLGIRQAKEAAESIKKLSINVLISSDLKRATETADVISKVIGIPLEIDPVFKERNYGIIEGRKKEDLKKEYPQYVNESGKFIPENEFSDAESLDDFYSRIINGVENLLDKYPDKNIMLVTHSGILRAIYAYFHNMPLNKVREVYNPEEVNCLIENY